MSFYAIVEAHCDRGKEYRHSALSRGTLATPEGGELDCSLADGHLPLAARASADGRKHIAMSFESLFNAGPGAETKDLKAVI